MLSHQDPKGSRFVAGLAHLAHDPSASVLCALTTTSRRQSELLGELVTLDESSLGASLRELDAAGLVARRVDPGPPLRVLYQLTPHGFTLATALRALRDWALNQA